MTPASLTIHHLVVSQSDRIVWLCEELHLPYRIVRYRRDPVTRLAPADYRALHPAGTAPVVTDGALSLAETGAIVAYILARYADGRLQVAADAPGFADYLYWLHYANGSLMPAALMSVMIERLGGCHGEVVCESMRERYARAYPAIERRLGGSEFFGGTEFTAADIMMLFPLSTMRRLAPFDVSGLPNLGAWLRRVTARPAYIRAAEAADGVCAPFVD